MDNKNFNNGKINFEDGLKSFLNHEFLKAEIFFLKSLEFVPDRISTIFYLIQIYVKIENPFQLNTFLKNYEHISENNVFKFGLAFQAYFKNDYSKSIDICSNILETKNSEFENQTLLLLASCYVKKKYFIKSIKIYRNILKQDKKNYSALYNISSLLSEVGKVRQSYCYLEKALLLSPDNKNILWDMSLCLLSMGDLEKGFSLYENRFIRKKPQTRKFNQIQLLENLYNLGNKKLLVWSEQGFGDTILFSRFVIDLLKYTKKIYLVVNLKLKDVFVHLDRNIVLIDEHEVKEKLFDYQIPVGSIPRLLNIKQKSQISFYPLKIPNIKTNNFDTLFDSKKLNIGIALKGNSDYLRDEYRSTSFKNFSQFIKNDNFNVYNLSSGITNKEMTDFKSLHTFNAGELNFYDLTFFLKKLDIVISVDTAICHLCGILGIKCILVLNYNSYWVWFNETNKNAWYPSINIIKQKKFNDWQSLQGKLKFEVDKIYNKKF